MAAGTLDLALTDPPARCSLTGAPNRALLLETLNPMVALARRYARGIAVLHVRIAGAAHAGGEVGASVLRESAEVLRDGTRDCDVVARISGHEFAVALTEIWESDAAARVAHRLYRSLRSLNGLSDGGRCHIGVACYPADGVDSAALLSAAEAATPSSRAIGFASAAIGRGALRRARLGRDLGEPEAMSRFELHYQPIRGLGTGGVVGAESLLRWNRGASLLPAADFIELATRSGRIRALDRWSTEQAFRTVARWRAGGWNGWMAINLSSRSLTDPTLIHVVRRLMEETGAPAEALVFEITEGGALVGDRRALGVLEGLRGLGARIAVDDFGTGYASFEYLCDFDPDIVKVDRAFLRSGGGRGSAGLLSALVDVAHRLGKPVVAEGVEQSGDLELALNAGCEMAQGYFVGRPMSAAAFLRTQIVQPRRLQPAVRTVADHPR